MYEICSACSTQWQSKNTVKISSFMSNYHLVSLKLTYRETNQRYEIE